MTSVIPTQMTFTTTERVTMGQPARDALRAQAEAMGARKVFLLTSDSLRRNTDEIAQIE
ncbi:alcohol dehydrogenase, partial [Pseudomonas sp. MPR-R2A5]